MTEDDLQVLPDLPVTVIRWRLGEPRVTGARPPLAPGHPATRLPCIGCLAPLGTSEPTSVLVIGPGANPAVRAKAAARSWVTAVAVIVHAACAGAGPEATERTP